MLRRLRGKRWWAAGIFVVLALLGVSLATQMRAQTRSAQLCNERGGLIVRARIPKDAVFAESQAALFAAADPTGEAARGRPFNGVPVETWRGTLDLPLRGCFESGSCGAVLHSRSSASYLHRGASGQAYLISHTRSPYCAEGNSGEGAPEELVRARDYYSRLLGHVPVLCAASQEAMRSVHLVTQEAVSASNANLVGDHLQFRAWRVFRTGLDEALLEYNEFGIQTIGAKLGWAAARAFGVPGHSYSRSECWTGERRDLPPNFNQRFNLEEAYPIGRFVDPGVE